jgi:hypothetical protein
MNLAFSIGNGVWEVLFPRTWNFLPSSYCNDHDL